MFKKLKNIYEGLETTDPPSTVGVSDGFSINSGSKASTDSNPKIPPNVDQKTVDSLQRDYEQSLNDMENFKTRITTISDRQSHMEEYISDLLFGYQGKQKEIDILRAKNLSLSQSVADLTKESEDTAKEHANEMETHISAYKKVLEEAEMCHVVSRNELSSQVYTNKRKLIELISKWNNSHTKLLQFDYDFGDKLSNVNCRISNLNDRLNHVRRAYKSKRRDYEVLRDKTSKTVGEVEDRFCGLEDYVKSKFECVNQLDDRIHDNYSRLRQHFVNQLKKKTDLIKDQETQISNANTAVRETIERSDSAISSLEERLCQRETEITRLNSELTIMHETSEIDKMRIDDLYGQIESLKRENEALVRGIGVDATVQTESTESVDELERIRCLVKDTCGEEYCLYEVLETEFVRREEEKIRLENMYEILMERMESSLQPYLPLVIGSGREDRLIGGLNDMLADIAIYREFFDGNTVRRNDSYDVRFRDIIGRMVNPSSKVIDFINNYCDINEQILTLLERFVESGSIGSLHSASLVGSLKSLVVQFGELTSLSESYCAMTCVSIEGVKLEYFRHVLYKYMTGCDSKTLARVICSIVSFPHNKLKAINKYHNL